MIIGGLQKFTLLDYPDKIAAIIFTQGCNFRCQFCYNPMLVWPIGDGEFPNKEKDHTSIEEDDLFQFLKDRIGKLEGVVITGGEPTIHSDLPDFIRKIRDFGYFVKLDTNGTNPKMLRKLINEDLIDYIAMDVKASEDKYQKICGINIDFKKIQESVKIIMDSKLPYEFRTTLQPGEFDEIEIKKIGKLIKGADKWYLQNIKTDIELVNKNLEGVKPFLDKEMKNFENIGKEYVKLCQAR